MAHFGIGRQGEGLREVHQNNSPNLDCYEKTASRLFFVLFIVVLLYHNGVGIGA